LGRGRGHAAEVDERADQSADLMQPGSQSGALGDEVAIFSIQGSSAVVLGGGGWGLWASAAVAAGSPGKLELGGAGRSTQ